MQPSRRVVEFRTEGNRRAAECDVEKNEAAFCCVLPSILVKDQTGTDDQRVEGRVRRMETSLWPHVYRHEERVRRESWNSTVVQ